MAVKAQDEVRELVDFSPEGALVTSAYLNVDPGEFPSPDLLQSSFNSLIHEAESMRKEREESLSHQAAQSLRADLERLRDWFGTGEIDRDNTFGFALFACDAAGYWQVVRTTTPVSNRVEFGPRPYVAPLAAFLSHTKPTAILLTDRKVARILTMSHGDVKEWSEFEDWGPSLTSQGDWSQMRYQRRVDHFAKHHVDRAAELLLRLLQHYPFDWLILGTEVSVQREVEDGLHPYLKDRVVGHISVRVDAGIEEVVERATELREQTESDHLRDLMERVKEYAGAGGRGTIGLTDTLQALNEQKVHILLIQEGFTHAGAICDSCGLLVADEPGACPGCGEPTRAVPDIVGYAVQRAFELGSLVEVATEAGFLDEVENVASIMYY